MQIISIKVPDALAKEIEYTSEKKGMSKSHLVREAVAHYLHENHELIKPGSFLELAEDLCGSAPGPKDLSTNKKYFEDFGE